MSWIKEIDEDVADAELKEIYEFLKKSRGKVSNILRAHSLNPEAMRSHMDLYMAVMFRRDGFPRKEAEMVGTFVSSLNGCDYCVNHHAEALAQYWKDDDKVKTLIVNYRNVDLSERELAMLEYAEKLTLHPQEMAKADLEPLRKAGVSDANILDLALVISYFNFVNRMALGLGVEFDDDELKGYKV